MMTDTHALPAGAMLAPEMSEGRAPDEYTIDELATHTQVPSRTIRFYQSTGALPKPIIKGRVAYYGPLHVERLQQITVLQDRGLQIKAIRDVLDRAEKGEFSVQEWLGSHDELSTPWTGDRPKVMSEAELRAELEGRRPGLVGELVRVGAIERKGDTYFVESPSLLSLALRLDKVGVPLETAQGAFKLLQKHLGRLSEDLASYFIKNADVLGDRGDVLSELRPVSIDAVRVVFAREMERTVRKATESGAAATFTRRRRDTKRR